MARVINSFTREHQHVRQCLDLCTHLARYLLVISPDSPDLLLPRVELARCKHQQVRELRHFDLKTCIFSRLLSKLVFELSNFIASGFQHLLVLGLLGDDRLEQLVLIASLGDVFSLFLVLIDGCPLIL